MELSILIAKIISVCYLSLGIGIIFNKKYYDEQITKLLDNSAVLLYGGFIAIIVGIFLVDSHNIWIADWTVLITLIGWIAIIKGVSLLIYPKITEFYKKTIFKPRKMTKLLVPILLFVGLLFGYYGFML